MVEFSSIEPETAESLLRVYEIEVGQDVGRVLRSMRSDVSGVSL